MSDLFEDFTLGEVHIRDKYQFELKSEYLPVQTRGEPSYTTELYFFIPPALQINKETYLKSQFYRDQTSLIRYKTPLISLDRLLGDESDSFLQTLKKRFNEEEPTVDFKEELYELKLFANVVRSRVRDRVTHMMEQLALADSRLHFQLLHTKMLHFLDKIKEIREAKKEIEREILSHPAYRPLKDDWNGIDEFISVTLQHYLTLLLEAVRRSKDKLFQDVDTLLTKLIIEEDIYRKEEGYTTIFSGSNPETTSKAIWRLGNLNKYVSEVLYLNIKRNEPKARFQEMGAMIAAGIAMTVYAGLLAWQGSPLVINSATFIILSVILYILKDRLKEGMKSLSTHLASRLYPDYTTDIRLPDSEKAIGKVSEYANFLERSQVATDILKLRERAGKEELEDVRLLEKVLYFRKDVEIFPEAVKRDRRLRRVNDLFRFNISQFLIKASNAEEDYLHLNSMTGELEMLSCPKIYHIHLILKKTYLTRSRKKKVNIDTFRLTVDKEGIQRVERL